VTVFALLPLLILVIALADVITRQDWQVKHLPKLVWVLLIVFLPLVGSILWFAVGREWGGMSVRIVRPSSSSAPAPSASASASRTELELAALEDEIAADRIRRLEAELEAKRRERGE